MRGAATTARGMWDSMPVVGDTEVSGYGEGELVLVVSTVHIARMIRKMKSGRSSHLVPRSLVDVLCSVDPDHFPD